VVAEYGSARWFFKRRVGRYEVRQIALASQWFRLWRPESVFDLGCGIGSYLAGFEACGCKVAGCELGYDVARKYIRGAVRDSIFKWDATIPMTSRHGADLVLCLDIMEHIPKDKHATVWANLKMLGRGPIIFSGGLPGQPGYGHIACMTRDQWIDEAQANGLEWQQHETEEALAAMDVIGDPIQMRDRVLVFRRVKA